MKTIIAGSRQIAEYGLVCEAMKRVNWEITEIVSGGARGIDSLGEKWARENEVPVKIFMADWDVYGKAAGPIRNAQMAKYADRLVAIWDGKSRGTANMISEAKELGLQVVVFLEDELKNASTSNPIKNNPIFGNEVKDFSETGVRHSVTTKTISFNGRHLTVYEDPKKNTPVVNMILGLIEEVERLSV